ncbi:N-6 DNA methylase [Caldovatus aquaticus]|uniref:site-specific DNA-methyltransferase (adenine-specific) n=1 Tax=Caldovatus aquaticus TaxID=2865671 RepID=A0ABS7EYE6_9PROT|nr:N-6 DNA methylase [Caldovatus aquaticus]MBW8268383.1 N-6 DNA methylase [Caldovatus aquaticus]
MPESWRQRRLPEIVAELARRPGHNNVAALVQEILANGLGVAYREIEHEVRLEAVQGRADMLFGATVFEFKRDLRREMPDVQARLPDYLAECEARQRRSYVGIATDGAEFVAFELRDGALAEIGRHRTRPEDGAALLAWLESAVSDRTALPPDPLTVRRELGRESLAFGRAMGRLEALWARLKDHPEVRLKRQLWDGLLRVVYGAETGDDSLFLQHTYLTIVTKTMATRVLALDIERLDAADILSGAALRADGIHGAVESDFFDWVLEEAEGRDLVLRLARQTARFDLPRAEVDVLKALYESLIDRRDRHGLGEYYTPDWLAARLVARAIERPLESRVLDPACGSGTFLFHAIRRLRAAAREAGWTPARALKACEEQVRGVDVHPVAVIIARVTWLLALGEDVARREGDLHVPVFLGDSMQWARQQAVGATYMEVSVPEGRPLRVPEGLARDPALYDRGVRELADGLAEGVEEAAMARRLARIPGVAPEDAKAMAATYAQVLALYREGRDAIWPFVLRNLARPLWLARPDQRAEVVIGNPPWVAYRHLSAEMKPRVKEALERMNLWVGGALATNQDLAALFWARCAQRYLKRGGTIAFVMPRSALTGPVFAGLRAGDLRDVHVRIEEAWSLDNQDVSPLFPVPACVLIGRRDAQGPPPDRIWRAVGDLPARDATAAQAERALRWRRERWPELRTLTANSPYRARFRQGATIVPRRFFLVTRETGGRLGVNRAAPRVTGRTGALDKHPWNAVAPPSGPVEIGFQRPVLLGEGIAPFRLLPREVLGVIPMEEDGTILDARAAANAGYRHLAAWLRDIEAKWAAHAKRRPDGRLRMTLTERLDHQRGLSQQARPAPLRVVYAASGILPAAAILDDRTTIVEHAAYWAPARNMSEARYLAAILNSETTRAEVAHLQPRGEGGARHFDNLVWELPIPLYDSALPLHRDLAAAAERAERVAARVALDEAAHFTGQRRAIRAALAADGIAARLDALVARLLGGGG